MNWRWTCLFCHCILEHCEVLQVNFISFLVSKKASFTSCLDHFWCRLHHMKYVRLTYERSLCHLKVYILFRNHAGLFDPTWLSWLCTACLRWQATNPGTVINPQHSDEREGEASFPCFPPTTHTIYFYQFGRCGAFLGNCQCIIMCVFICCGERISWSSLSSYTADIEDRGQWTA